MLIQKTSKAAVSTVYSFINTLTAGAADMRVFIFISTISNTF